MVACRVCAENKKIKVEFIKNSYKLLKCPTCGLTYLDYNPKLWQITKFYSANYFKGCGLDFGYYNYFAEKTNLVKIGEKRLEEIERLTKIGKILDVGCATGFFLEVAKNRGWQVSGLEISSFAGNVAKKKFGKNIIIGELKEDTFPKNYFDSVTLWDTIEHLPNPKNTLKIIYKNLKNGGVLALSTGNIESLLAQISGRSWHLYHLPEHLSFFSPKTIAKLLENCGFKVISISHPGSYYTLEYLVRRASGSYPNRLIKIFESLISKSFLARLSLYINLFDIMTVYARKV